MKFKCCSTLKIGHFKTKWPESVILPDVLSECGGTRCAEPEPEGRKWSAPSPTSHNDGMLGWFADKFGLVFIPWNCFYILKIDKINIF